jgi:hypothetical protein
MVRGEAIIIENVFDAVCGGIEVSVAVTVTLKAPALAGVPPSTPPVLSVRPEGRPVADQE